MNSINFILLIISICCIIVLVTLFYLFIKSLEVVNKTLSKIVLGDLTQKVNVHTRGFFKILCNNINKFILNIRGFINKITIMTDKVMDYCDGLNEDTRQVEMSSNEIYSSINEVSTRMEVQVNDMFESGMLVDEIVNGYKGIKENGGLIENVASSAMNTVEESNKIYEELIKKMHESAGSNSKLALKAKNLYEKAFKIQGIADAVSEISSRTEILSLNASIEAAKAGEYGTGFSVVANEIRKLADISASQSKEIQKIIDGIKVEITEITSGMDKEVLVISENIKFSTITKENLSKIFLESRNVLSSIKDINEIIDMQSKKIANIKKSFDAVASTSENITAATQEIAAVNNIHSSVSHLTDMNKEVKIFISSFAKGYKIDDKTKKQIESGFKILKAIAQNDKLITMEYETCTKILREKVKECPNFELLGLVQKDGLRKAITLDYEEKDVYVSFSHRPYFKEAIKGNEYRSEPYISEDTNNYCIAMAVPVKNHIKEIIGVLVGDFILE